MNMKFLWVFLVVALAPVSNAADNDCQALEAAIADLTATFPARYPKRFQRQAKKLDSMSTAERAAFSREALLANPLLQDQPLLFTTRKQFRRDHHNTATMFQRGEINTGSYDPPGTIKLLEVESGQVKTLVDAGATGMARDPEVSWDGTKFVFSMRDSKAEDYHIYEYDLKKKTQKQLSSRSGVSDIDPVYLPDGKVIFSSTRDYKVCMCNRHIMANLYRMEDDGANIIQMGKNTLFEGHSSVMEDGSVLYDRWEYVDRHFGVAQGLWTMNPDGTVHRVFYGNNTASPGGVLDARQIPGTQKVIATFVSCHGRPWGALAILDRSKGVDGAEPVERIWPESARELIKIDGDIDAFMKVRPRYEDPYPLADPKTGKGAGNYFLCARTIEDESERTGIYLIDVFGNETLVYEDAEFGCFDPMPVVARKKPAARPDLRNYEGDVGKLYVQNVYEGTHMEGIEPGEIKYLRVIETPEKQAWTLGDPWASYGGAQWPAISWSSLETKRVLGEVPVEEDGSVYFEMPSDKFIFFQLLDKDHKMVQSMRSGTMIQPGETQGCVGCHESRVEAPPAAAMGLAATARRISRMGEGYSAGELFSYAERVQPVFDKHCVSCHDYEQEAGEKLNLCGDKTLIFNTSYENLWKKGMIQVEGAGYSDFKEAKSWGANQSKLTDYLEGHEEVKLTAVEKQAIHTWLDLNAIYYPVYESAYDGFPAGRTPLTKEEIGEIYAALGMGAFKGGGEFYNAGHKMEPPVSFDRPELSPVLKNVPKDSAEYNRLLTVIQNGQKRLQETPRADMPGFVPSERNQQMNAKYQELRRSEEAFRKAAQEGRKLYDADVQPMTGE